MATAAPKMSIQQANMLARQAILAQAIEMTQNIYSNTITTPGSTANVINVIPRNVGLITRFTVEITATLTSTGGTTLLPTNFNIANLLSNIQYNDLNNQTRIQTTGWHMNLLNSVRHPARGPFGSALTNTAQDVPIKYGSNYASGSTSTAGAPGLFLCPASIGATTTTASAIVKMTYEIPLAYDDSRGMQSDLRGSIYANVVNATQLLQLTLNPAPIVGPTTDNTTAIFSGTAGAGSIVAATINVYQHFLDQLPVGNKGPILPIQDLSTIYLLNTTTLTGMVQNQDFPIPYANFRDFLSTFLVWDNGQTAATAAVAGTDIAYFALQSANFTNIFKIDPFLSALMTRKKIQTDLPMSCYYFDHRRKPLSTIQYGNLELIMNASASLNTGAQALLGFEAFGLINTISGAGSLPAG